MVYPFICGPIQCIHPQDDDEDDVEEWPSSPCLTPKKSRKSSLFRNKENKNPYANRGLDKFSAVLAELEEKRQQIYTQKGSEEISFVRFVFSDSNHIRPVVVKARDRKKQTTTTTTTKPPTTATATTNNNNHVKHSQESSAVPEVELQAENESGNHIAEHKNKNKGYLRNIEIDIWRPSHYLPFVVMLIMVFLAMFGRSFAILCTSLGWYLVPAIKERSSKTMRKSKKKGYARRASDKKMAYDGTGTLSFKGGDRNLAGGKKTLVRRFTESDASAFL